MSTKIPWNERVPVLSIHGAQATEREVERLASELMEANGKIAALREALEQSSLGQGPFDREPLRHAENCIEDMKECARRALADTAIAAHEHDPGAPPYAG